MTPAALTLWLALVPAPAYYPVPSWPQSMEPIVSYWADQFLIPHGLALPLIKQESGFDPKQFSREWKRDKLGVWRPTEKVLAEGIAMITTVPKDREDHVKKAGMTMAEFDPWDANDSLRVGMAFLGRLLRRFDYQWRPASAGYNAGAWAAAQWWEEGRSLPRETTKYVKIVLGGR